MNIIRLNVQNLIIVITVFLSYSAHSQYHVKPFDISKKITALETTKYGYIYYGTESGEFGKYDGLQFIRIDNLDVAIHAIESNENFTYLSTSKGLYEFSNGKMTQVSPNNLDILSRSYDNSILVTSNGIYNAINSEYLPDKEEFFDVNEIEFGAYFKMGDLECLRIDKKVFFNKNRWREVISHAESDFSVIPWDTKKMLVVDRKALITFDSEGYVDTLLHLNSETKNKLFKIQGKKVLLCTENTVGVYDMRNRELDTLYSLSTDLITSANVDDWGNIWISAGSYLYQIIDRSGDKWNEPPRVELESIRINGKKQELKSSFRLDKNDNEVEIDYSGVQMTFPQNLEFQTSLSSKNQSLPYSAIKEGVWTAPTKERNIEYRNLEPGKYTFQLRGTVDGKYYTYTQPVTFHVESDFFQSVWLIGFIGAVGILLSALFFNNRYNTLKQNAEQDRKKLIQENKMLTLQQKALQLQMNPHFVFNSLNSIQGLIASEENQKARKYLQEFSTMMRSVLNQSREETILLTEEVKYLKSYLNLEQMANNNKFDWTVDIDSEIEDDIRIPTMIIQPFVENAIIHGIKALKERKGKISLTFRMDGSKIICKVVDNGIGRAAASQLKSSNYKSVAIDVVKERLSSKVKSSKQSPIRYIDILDREDNVIGTEVLISIPIMN